MEDNKVRLQKFLANSGVASRRKCEELILEGKISVNGKVVSELGTKIDPTVDKVTYCGKLIHNTEKLVYILLNKPIGYTSHDCVMKLRRIFNTKKVGHTGTLDPAVEGVLPICIGEATKVVPYLTDTDKFRYLAKAVKKAEIKHKAENFMEELRKDSIQSHPSHQSVKLWTYMKNMQMMK